jgi:hypothetical protein
MNHSAGGDCAEVRHKAENAMRLLALEGHCVAVRIDCD